MPMILRPGNVPVPGLLPNTGQDALALIQSALDTLGYAYLPAGRYYVDTPPVRGAHEWAMLTATGKTIFGDGRDVTELRFRGSANFQDWRGIELGGDSSWLAEIGIDTSELTNTTEQTHAVHTIGPASSPAVTGCRINHPVRGTEKGGDAWQIVGYDDGRMVTDVVADDNDIIADRSAIGVHSGVAGITISNNRTSAGNTDFDFEGSGSTSGVVIFGNVCELTPGRHGTGSLQFQLVTGATVHRNRFKGRGFSIVSSTQVEIFDNTIIETQSNTAPVIEIIKACDGINIHDNTIIRAPSCGNGAVIHAGPHGTGTPKNVIIGPNNTVVQMTTGQVFSTEGVVGVRVVGNTVIYGGAPNVSWGLIPNGSTTIRTGDIHVIGNVWQGPLKGIIGLSGSYAGCGSVESSDNIVTGATYGIAGYGMSSGSGIVGPVTSTRDSMPEPVPTGFVAVL